MENCVRVGGGIDNHGRDPNAVERGNLTGNSYRLHEMMGNDGREGFWDDFGWPLSPFTSQVSLVTPQNGFFNAQ